MEVWTFFIGLWVGIGLTLGGLTLAAKHMERTHYWMPKVVFPDECAQCGFDDFEWKDEKSKYWLKCSHCGTYVDGPYP